MQQLPQNTSETRTTLSKVSQRAMAMAQALNDFYPAALDKFSNKLPSRIEDALDFPTVKEVIASAGEIPVRAYVEYEIITLAGRVKVGGNISNGLDEFIAQELIKAYPNETLADFKLCFQRAAVGQYNIAGEKDIFRLDGIVIRRWMEKYLEEKYQVIENKLNEEKEDFKKQFTITENDVAKLKDDLHRKRLREWKEAVEKSGDSKKIRPLTDDEMRKEGQANKRKAAPYKPVYSELETLAKLKLQRAASEFYKGRKSGFSLKIFEIDGIEFTAENEQDAMQIYEIAEQMKVKIVKGKVVWL